MTPAEDRSAWSARGWAIYLGWIVITLDGSALNLALPAIARDLSIDGSSISWVVDAYTLPLATLLLLGGSLGDRIGAARLFRIGAIGFASASAGAALSPTIGALIAFRAAQGGFAALLLPMVLALVGKSFARADQRSKAVNLLTVFSAPSLAAGPLLGGLLTDTVGWRAVFWLTVPIALTAAALVTPSPDERPSTSRLPVDIPGQVSGALGLVLIVGAVIELGRGAPTPLLLAMSSSGLVLLVAFVMIEHRVAHPVMPPKVFRNIEFRGALIAGFAYQVVAYGLQFFLAVHLQRAWDISALVGGLMLVSYAVGILATSIALTPILLRSGTRTLVVLGASIAGAGVLSLLFLGDSGDWALLVVAEFVIGFGAGTCSTGLNKAAGTALGPAAAGLGSGMYNTSRQVGQSVGIAVLGALAVFADQRLGLILAITISAIACIAIVGASLRIPTKAPVALTAE